MPTEHKIKLHKLFNEDDVRAVAKDLMPIITLINEMKTKHSLAGETLRIYSWHDGQIVFDSNAMNGWTIIAETDGKIRLKYEYEANVEDES